MICYQDEKMYGEKFTDMTMEELDKKIEELEIEFYGCRVEDMPDVPDPYKGRKTVYDIKKGKMVPIEEAEYY